mmetsp:Transcript_17647/g.56218  ORF Transcript_17647/g.56218 Transcript_17647/m.56218 type:complete len:334 (+) Transcript_17647:94-1095(+)
MVMRECPLLAAPFPRTAHTARVSRPHGHCPLSLRLSGHRELGRERAHPLSQVGDGGLRLHLSDEMLELCSGALLQRKRQLDGLVQVLRHPHEIGLAETARGQRRRADANPAGRGGGDVATHCVLVERDADRLGELLELGAGQPLRPQVPEHEVVVGTARDDGVASRHERGGERLRVRLDTPDVLAEGWLLRLSQRDGERRDLVVVRPSLQAWEDSEVDRALKPLAVKDDAGARPAQRLVRGRRDDIAVLERVGGLLRRDEARDVRHVAHQQRADRVGDPPHPRVVPVPRVGRRPCDEQLWAEEPSALFEAVVVDQARLGRHLIRERLEVDGSC